MTLIIMMEYGFSGVIRVYHNYLRHLRSTVLISRTCLRLN